MRVLLTGSTGFLGSKLLQEFFSRGWNLRLIVRNPTKLEARFRKSSQLIVSDLTKIHDFSSLVKDVDLIVNAAGVVTDWAPREEYFTTHRDVTKRLCHALAVTRSRAKLIHISTIDVIGNVGGLSSNEKQNYSNSNIPYIKSKVLAEKAILNSSQRMNFTIFRPAWILGPGDTTLIPGLIDQLKMGIMIYIGSKRNHIPLIYIDNLVRAIMRGVQSSKSDRKIYNICDSTSVTWDQFISYVASALNVQFRELVIPKRLAFLCAIIIETFARWLRFRSRPILTTTVVEMLGQDTKINTSQFTSDFGPLSEINIKKIVADSVQQSVSKNL